MIIFTGEITDIPFLLVDENMAGVEGIAPTDMDIRFSFQGGTFVNAAAEPMPIGNGWYMYPVMEDEPGMLIMEVSAPGTHTWRDIHQVMDQQEFQLMLVAKPIRTGVTT